MAGVGTWAQARVVYGPAPTEQAPPRDDTEVFIQWKGTNVCFDFWCECGGVGHYDGFFAYTVKCPACDEVWTMPNTLYLVKANEDDASREPVVPSVD